MLKNDPGAAGSGGFFVTIASGAQTTVKRVEGDILTVGRATDCHLTFSDNSLSRRHMTIRLKDGVCYIEDHGSSNGTFINGKPVKQHTQVKLKADDVITLGQAPMSLMVSSDAPAVTQAGAGKAQTRTETIVTSTDISRVEQKKAASPAPQKPNEPQAQKAADLIMQDAQRRAALMIQEAEMQAERRTEEIHRRANEKKTEADETYQKRMNEAFRDSEKIYQKTQEDSLQILESARHSASEIRRQADVFAEGIRKRAEADAMRILEEAQQTARDLKEQRLLEAGDLIKKKEDELLSVTRDKMTEQLASFEADLAKEASRRRGELQIELDGRRAKLELENLSLLESVAQLKSENSELLDIRKREEASIAVIEGQLRKQNDESRRLEDEIASAKETMTGLNQKIEGLRGEIDSLKKENELTLKQSKDAQVNLAKLNEDIRDSAAKAKIAEEQAQAELVQVRVRLEESKAKIEKEENARFDEMKLQTTRRVRDLEVQMLRELDDKKERMAREITLVVETFFKNNPEAKGRALRGLQEEIFGLLEKQIVTANHDEGAKAKQASLVELKRREKWSTATIGAIMGVILALGGRHIMDEVEVNHSPMQQRVIAAQEARKADLEQRKFNPVMTPEFKGTYVDNVVYTKDFVAKYSDDEFQKQFMKSLSGYMFKTWKTDEDKTIQLIGISSALVKMLAEKRANIHPDFQNQALEKMREDENAAVVRMRDLLGSQVRFEAFKKFEKDFYEKYSVAR